MRGCDIVSHGIRMIALSTVVVSFIVGGLGLASWPLAAQTVNPDPESPLIQMAHIEGDPYGGFSFSCLIVYPDARYHREQRTQIPAGMERYNWEAPKVFESHLEAQDMVRLRAIIEDPSFASIKGTIGTVRNPSSKLRFSLVGVAPYEDIDIRTISVEHLLQPQVFEITETHLAERQEPLRGFLKWIKDAESHPAARLLASMANNCTSLSPANHALFVSAEFPKTLLRPTLITGVAPKLPPNIPKPRSVLVEYVVNPDGTVGHAVVKSHVSPDVAQSVTEAITKWKFRPGRLLGVPIAFKLETEIRF